MDMFNVVDSVWHDDICEYAVHPLAFSALITFIFGLLYNMIFTQGVSIGLLTVRWGLFEFSRIPCVYVHTTA